MTNTSSWMIQSQWLTACGSAEPGSTSSRLCRNYLKPPRSIATQWSGTTWRSCRSPPSTTGGRSRLVSRPGIKKGVTLREVRFDHALIRGIWEIYNECPVRQGKPFRHYGKNIQAVHEEEATFPDSSIFIGAFLGETLIGFIKLVTDETRTQAGLMNIVSMIGHRDKAPTNALVTQAVRSCAERGIPYLVYSNFAYGKKLRDSLSDFKERNGFQRIDLPRYYVPLSSIGWAAFRLRLHRRFVDHFPEPFIAKIRELRNAWYNRKLPGVAEVS